MTDSKSGIGSEKWYENDVLWSFIIVLGIFGLGGLLLYLGLDVQTTAYVIGGCFFAVVLLPMIPIISDGIKWVQHKRSSVT